MERKILIIDDEKWFFEPILERLDYEQITYDFCKNGSCGLKKLKDKKNSYKAIILDMKVSLGDLLKEQLGKDIPGILIFKEIRKIEKNIPVICWTVHSDEEVIGKITSLQGKYFRKAGNEEDFFDEVKRCAGSPEEKRGS
ncbi:MAG: response regulator [bacterium]|nr:response regulator [bacterium]